MAPETLASRVITFVVSLSAFGLLSIWPLPGTIALRHVLLGLGLVASIYFLRPQLKNLLKTRAWPLWILIGLFFWLILHLWIFSTQPALQFYEFRSIWLRSLASLPLGLALGIYLSGPNPKKRTTEPNQKTLITLLLFIGFLSTFLIFASGYLYKCYMAKQWLTMQALAWSSFPYREKPPFVVATALLLPLCFVLLSRVFQGKERAWWVPLTVIATGLCVASNYLTNTKNGMAMVAITAVLFTTYIAFHFAFGWAKKSIAKTLVSVCLSVCLLLGIAWGVTLHLDKNPAWSHLISNAKVGVDIDHQNYWKNRNVYGVVPINDKGTSVDVSTYERTAWFTAGTQLLADMPQGFGLVHHSFGWMALERWPDFYPPIGTLRGMTHSGWMDLALGIGIPGLLLILIPLAASWYRSLRLNNLWGAYAMWAIPIITLTYLTTETTGAHHFIELQIFMTAFFVGLTIINPLQEAQSSS